MGTATGHVCPGLSMSCSGDKRNSFLNLNHPLFASTLPSNFKPFTSSSIANGLFSRGYLSLSMNMFFPSTRAPVVCMAQRKASGSSKKKTKIVRLVSTAGTGFFYAMKKSKKLDKLELKKYDPKVKRHVLFRESK